MTGRPNKPVGQRDLKPAITWRPERDDRRLHRVALILLDILDTAGTPEEGPKS